MKFQFNSISKNLRSLLVLSILAYLSMPSLNYADNRRREEQKQQEQVAKAQKMLQFYQQKLEDLKVQRWQDKRNSVASQEAFQKMWEDLKREVDQENQIKLRKEDMLLRLQSQAQDRKNSIEEQQNRYKQFRYSALEKVDQFVEKMEGGFPHQIQDRQTTWNSIREKLNNEDESLRTTLEASLQMQTKEFDLGESSELIREQMLIQGNALFAQQHPDVKIPKDSQSQMRAGITIRLGQFYKGFISTESDDVAILIKSGKIGPNAWIWQENIPEESRKQFAVAEDQLLKEGSETAILVPIDVQLRNASGEGFAAKTDRNFVAAVIKEYKSGGFAMHLILATLIIGFLFSIEKALRLSFHSLGIQGPIRKVMNDIRKGNLGKAESDARGVRGSQGKVLQTLLSAAPFGKEEVEGQGYAAMLRETPVLERNLGTINVLAAAAPLLGLLGTVSGMINLFTAITIHGTDDPKFMADGIAEALVTTKWGLLAAIPLLLVYAWLADWANRISSDLERNSAETINLLFGSSHRNTMATNNEREPARSEIPETVEKA